MIEDGRAFGNTIALKHLLKLFERKGLLSPAEITRTLDDALEESRSTKADLAPGAHAAAGIAIGYLYDRN